MSVAQLHPTSVRCSARDVRSKALSNTHDSERSASVAPYLDHESEFVRGAAARAVGALDAPGAADVLSERLATEPRPRVREAIADGLTRVEEPTPTSLQRVADFVRSEPRAEARVNMAEYLGAHVGGAGAGSAVDAQVVATIKELAIGDESAAVRRRAAVALRDQ